MSPDTWGWRGKLATLAENPSSTQGSSRPPLTSSPGDLVLSSGLHGLLHTSFPSHPPPIKNVKYKKNQGPIILPWFNEQKTEDMWYSCDSTLAEKILRISSEWKLARFL